MCGARASREHRVRGARASRARARGIGVEDARAVTTFFAPRDLARADGVDAR